MKKIIAILSVLFLVPNLYAQQEYKEYHSSYFRKDFNIMLADKDKEDEFSFYISVQPVDRTKYVTVSLLNKKVPEFIGALNEGRQIYLKWKETAIENNVTELDKDMNLSFPLVTSCFYYGNSWNFDFSTNIKARFKIIEDEYVIILSSGKLKSSKNEHVTCDGFYLVFTNVDELDDFVNRLDLDEAKKFLTDKSSVDSLFE